MNVSLLRRALPLLMAAAFAVPAFAQAPANPGAQAAAPLGDARSTGLSADLMYRLLVADVALQRGEPALAARAYFEAARESREPALARRATEVALVARQRALAIEALAMGGPGGEG